MTKKTFVSFFFIYFSKLTFFEQLLRVWTVEEANKSSVDQLLNIDKEQLVAKFLQSKGRNVKVFFRVAKDSQDKHKNKIEFLGSHQLQNKSSKKIIIQTVHQLSIGAPEVIDIMPGDRIGLLCPDRGEHSHLNLKLSEKAPFWSKESLHLSSGMEMHLSHSTEQRQIVKVENGFEESIISCTYRAEISTFKSSDSLLLIDFSDLFKLFVSYPFSSIK